MGFRATLNFRKVKVALNPMYRIYLNSSLPKVAHHPAYQNSIRKNFTVPFLKYKRLNSVAMVTYSVTKIIPMCSPRIGQFFDTMIVTSTDKEW